MLPSLLAFRPQAPFAGYGSWALVSLLLKMLKILGEGYTFVPKKWELQKGRFQLSIRSFPVSTAVHR